MIPKQLKIDEFRFIKASKDKKGIETGWSSNSNYSFDNKELQEWLNKGENYGVLGGYGNLLIIDFDDKDAYNKVKDLMPETFTVLSANKRMPHLYYICDTDPAWFKVLDQKKNTLIDGQGRGKMVIGANCRNKNGQQYTILKDIEVTKICYSEIKAIIDTNFDDMIIQYDEKKIKKEEKLIKTQDSPITSEIKSKLKISQLLNENGINTSRNPTNCPFGHNSIGGKCFSFDDDKNGGVFNCFHCNKKGDVIHLFMELNKCEFSVAKTELCKKLNIKTKEAKLVNSINTELKEAHPITIIRRVLKQNPVYYDKASLWWLWNDNTKIWELTDETDLLNIMVNDFNLYGVVNSKYKNSLIQALKLEARKNKPKDPNDNWLQFGKRIIDINTKEEFESTKDYFFTNSIPYDLGDSEDTPTMDKIFEEWVGKENVRLLYEIIAYCTIRSYPINRIFVFLGKGSNGKTKYLELVSKFLGNSNICSTELDSLIQNRFESVKLYKKLACQMGETNFNEMNKTSIIKKLSGGDLIGFEFKNKNPFDERNYAKILISTNTLPITKDKTLGFYRRWVLTTFDRRFSEKKDILKDIPEVEYNNLARKSINILATLLEKREFTNEGTIEERMKRYEEKSNPLINFIETQLVKDFDGYVYKWELRDRFKAYLRSNNYRDWSDTEIGLGCKEFYEEAQRDGGKRVWLGCKWKEHETKEELIKEKPLPQDFIIDQLSIKQPLEVIQTEYNKLYPQSNFRQMLDDLCENGNIFRITGGYFKVA